MANGMISQEKFDNLPTENKLGIIYECLLRLESRVESRKWIHNSFAMAGGVVGGILAIMGKWFFCK